MRSGERVAGWLMACASWSALGITLLILLLFLRLSMPFFVRVDWDEFFTSTQWTPLYEVKQ